MSTTDSNRFNNIVLSIAGFLLLYLVNSIDTRLKELSHKMEATQLQGNDAKNERKAQAQKIEIIGDRVKKLEDWEREERLKQ